MRGKGKPQYKITAERELEIADIIKERRHLFAEDKSALNKEDLHKRNEADKAVEELVAAYAPFIEKLVQERIQDAGAYVYSTDDYISEAYIVAVQNARAFDPSKTEKPIRFSSYCSRPISSTISRLVSKSRSNLNIPSNKMKEARQWSHTLFDLSAHGIDATDDVVSEISGISSNQNDIRTILNSSLETELDESISPSYESDYGNVEDDESVQKINIIIDSVIKVFGKEKGEEFLIATGLLVYEDSDNSSRLVWNNEEKRKPNGSTALVSEMRNHIHEDEELFNKLAEMIKSGFDGIE